MARNIAGRRAAKAQRRKTVVAQKRKAEIDANSTAGQVRLAAATPIQHCLVSRGLFEAGMGTLVLARGTTPYDLTTAVFLLDTFGLGAKDVFLRQTDNQAFADLIDRMSMATPMEPADPAYARKLLRDLTGWSRGFGFLPQRHYETIERLFGTVDPNGSDAVFEFGKDGKPLVISAMPGADALWFAGDDEDDDDDIDGLIIDGEAEASPADEPVEHAANAAHD